MVDNNENTELTSLTLANDGSAEENIEYEYVELEEGQELPDGYEYEYEYVEVADGPSELDVIGAHSGEEIVNPITAPALENFDPDVPSDQEVIAKIPEITQISAIIEEQEEEESGIPPIAPLAINDENYEPEPSVHKDQTLSDYIFAGIDDDEPSSLDAAENKAVDASFVEENSEQETIDVLNLGIDEKDLDTLLGNVKEPVLSGDDLADNVFVEMQTPSEEPTKIDDEAEKTESTELPEIILNNEDSLGLVDAKIDENVLAKNQKEIFVDPDNIKFQNDDSNNEDTNNWFKKNEQGSVTAEYIEVSADELINKENLEGVSSMAVGDYLEPKAQVSVTEIKETDFNNDIILPEDSEYEAIEEVVEEPILETAPVVVIEEVVEEPVLEATPEVEIEEVVEEPILEIAPEVVIEEVVEEPILETAPEVEIEEVVEEPILETAPEVEIEEVVEEPVLETAPEVEIEEVVEEPILEIAPEVEIEEVVEEPVLETVSEVEIEEIVEEPILEIAPEVVIEEVVEEPILETAPEVEIEEVVEEPVLETAPEVVIEEVVEEPILETAPEVVIEEDNILVSHENSEAIELRSEYILPQIKDYSSEEFSILINGAKPVSKNDGIQSFRFNEESASIVLNELDFEHNELSSWNLTLFSKEIKALTSKVNELVLPRGKGLNRIVTLVKNGVQKTSFFNEDSLKIINVSNACVAVEGRFVCGDLGTNSGIIVDDYLTLPLGDFVGKNLQFNVPASGILSGPKGTLIYFFGLKNLLVPNSEITKIDAEKLQYKISKWYSGSLNDKYFEFDAKSASTNFEGNVEINAIHVNVNNSSYGWNVSFDNGLSMNLRDLREYQIRFGKMPSQNGVISYGQTKLTFTKVERIVVYESAQYFFYS